MQLESLNRGQSLYMDKPLEFILVPKCPLFGDSTVPTLYNNSILNLPSDYMGHMNHEMHLRDHTNPWINGHKVIVMI